MYHSDFGHTRVVAESIARGAGGVESVACALIDVEDLPPPSGKQLPAAWDALHEADAIIFGCPTFMGSVSAKFKAFMEASGVAWGTQRWKDKLAAGFTNAGGLSGDKVNCLIDIAMFAAQHSMVWVSQGLFYDAEGVNRMGSWIGMQAQSADGPPDETPPPEDHRTAELFGERVAHAAIRWTRGAAGAE